MSFVRLFVLAWLTIFFLSGCTGETSPLDRRVSMIELIATPERFDGHKVQVVGFLRLSPEDSLLYFSEDDYLFTNSANSVYLDLDDIAGQEYSLDAKWMFVEGTFENSPSGHLGLSSRFIHNITRFEEVIPRRGLSTEE